MKFCPNCGAQMDDRAAFCENCGTSMVNGLQAENAAGAATPAPSEEPVAGMTYGAGANQAQQAQTGSSYSTQPDTSRMQSPYSTDYGASSMPPKKSRLPLIIGIAVACLAVIVGIVFAVRAFVGGGKSKKVAESDFFGIQTNFLEERFAGVGAAATSDSFSSDITVSGTFESADPDVSKLAQLLDGTAVIFKADAKKNDLLANIVLNLQGSNVLEADMTLTDKEFGFAIPAADSNYYVGDLKKVMQNFGVSEEEVDAILKPTTMTGALNPQLFSDAFKSILDAGINENCLTITEKTTVNLDQLNETLEGTFYVWQPTLEDCKAVMNKLADEMETGVAIGELIKQMDKMGGTFILGDAQFENAEDMIKNFRENTDTYAQRMVDAGFKWEMATNADGKVVLISVKSNDVELGYQGLMTDQSVREQFFVAEKGNATVRIDNEATVSGKQWTGTATLATPRGPLTVNYDLDTSKYSVFGMPYGTVSLSLESFGLNVSTEIITQAGESSSTDMIFKVHGLGMYTNSYVDSVEITVNTTDKSTAVKPSGTKVDITDYTEEDYQALFADLSSKLQGVVLRTPAVMNMIQMFLF